MPTPPKYDYHECRKDGKFVCNNCGTRLVRKDDMGRHVKNAKHPLLPPPNGDTLYSSYDETANKHIAHVCGGAFGRAYDVKKHYLKFHKDLAKQIEAKAAEAAAAELECNCVIPIDGSATKNSARKRSRGVAKPPAVRKTRNTKGQPAESLFALEAARELQAQSTSDRASKDAATSYPGNEVPDSIPKVLNNESFRPITPGPRMPPQLSPSDAFQYPHYHNVDPNLLSLHSIGKGMPLTLRQQIRYRMLYTA